jgi:putative oxidoreductase
METQNRSTMNIVLWVLQGILALLFLNAGFLKTFRPIDEIAPTIFWVSSVPEPLVRFIGISELVGGIGLILPAAFKIRPELTTLAAAGLTAIMTGATIFHTVRGEFFVLPFTGILLALAAFITYGRWKLAPFIPKEKK